MNPFNSTPAYAADNALQPGLHIPQRIEQLAGFAARFHGDAAGQVALGNPARHADRFQQRRADGAIDQRQDHHQHR